MLHLSLSKPAAVIGGIPCACRCVEPCCGCAGAEPLGAYADALKFLLSHWLPALQADLITLSYCYVATIWLSDLPPA